MLDGQEFAAPAGAFGYVPRGSVHAFNNTGTGIGRLLITCTPAGLEVPFRAVRLPEAGSARAAPTMEEMIAVFAQHDVSIQGPPPA